MGWNLFFIQMNPANINYIECSSFSYAAIPKSINMGYNFVVFPLWDLIITHSEGIKPQISPAPKYYLWLVTPHALYSTSLHYWVFLLDTLNKSQLLCKLMINHKSVWKGWKNLFLFIRSEKRNLNPIFF